MNKNNRKKYYLAYSIIWVALIFLVFSKIVINGKTLVGLNDSAFQHYPFMIKVREFYRSLLFGLFTGDRPKLVDFNNYFGMDTIASLNYYGLGNPIFLITALMPKSFMPYAYSIIFLIKIYLSGVCFSEFCFYKEKQGLGVLIGAIIYVLSPFMVLSLEQLSFADILYQFPLLLIGIDKIINKKRSKTFVIAVMLTALNGYYFLYMATIMLAVYSIVVIWGKNKKVKSFFKEAFTAFLLVVYQYSIGIMLAAPVFIPSLIGFFQGYRSGSIKINGLKIFFDAKYYVDELINLFFYSDNKVFTLNIAVVMAIVILFFMCRGKYKPFKRGLVIAILAIQLNIVSYAMNGFSYSSDRWLFGFYFFISFICVDMFTVMLDTLKHNREKIVMTAIICLCAYIQPYIFCVNYESACVSVNDIQKLCKNTGGDLVETGARLDGNEEWIGNTSLFYDVAKAQIYQSIIPGVVLKAQIAFDLSDVENVNIIQGLDKRTELEALFNIKYYITKEQKGIIPYGFEKVGEDSNRNVLYKNAFQLPYGYTYDSCVKQSNQKNKIGIEKSWAYIASAGIEDADAEKIGVKESSEALNTCQKADCKINMADDGKYVLKFDKIKNATVYIKCKSDKYKRTYGNFIAGDKARTFLLKAESSVWYIPREYEVYNVGYYNEISKIEIDGVNDLEDIEVYYHSMDNYGQQIEKLSEYHLENVLMKDNKIKGNIYVPQNRLLCLSTPYIKGWKAYVDGKETEIIKVNGMFMGINLTPGEHSVELKFFTPGLRMGLVLLVLGILLLINLVIKERREEAVATLYFKKI